MYLTTRGCQPSAVWTLGLCIVVDQKVFGTWDMFSMFVSTVRDTEYEKCDGSQVFSNGRGRLFRDRLDTMAHHASDMLYVRDEPEDDMVFLGVSYPNTLVQPCNVF